MSQLSLSHGFNLDLSSSYCSRSKNSFRFSAFLKISSRNIFQWFYCLWCIAKLQKVSATTEESWGSFQIPWCGPQTCTEHKVAHCIIVTFTVRAHVLISTVVHNTGGVSIFHDNWQETKESLVLFNWRWIIKSMCDSQVTTDTHSGTCCGAAGFLIHHFLNELS